MSSHARRLRRHPPHPTGPAPRPARGARPASPDLADPRLGACILCGSLPVAALGFFTPTFELGRTMGVPAGKSSVYAYALCRLHADGGREAAERAEAVIIRQACVLSAASTN